MSTFKILYAEDDETLAFLTKDNLEQHGYDVTHCADGNSCLQMFKENQFDICIFDIMLPKMDGFELATAIRKTDNDIPIIFLSAKTLKEDRIKGLKLGADDYLVKPFSIEELLLKIRVFLKRSHKIKSVETSIYTIGRFEFDTQNFALFNESERITLTPREAELLQFFLEHKNTVLKRDQILNAIWGNDDYYLGRSLDVYISKLRKIFADDKRISIDNLHGIGFKFVVSD